MAKLYEIVDELVAFTELNEGLEDEQAYKDTFEALQGELDDKVEQWCKAALNIKAEKEAVEVERKRLEDREKALTNKYEHMQQMLMMYMQALGIKKAGRTIGAKIQNKGGAAPLILAEEDATKLPEEFQRIKVEANKTAIREALEAGRELPFALIGERGQYLKIG